MTLKNWVLLRSVARRRAVNYTPMIMIKFQKQYHKQNTPFNWKTPTTLAIFGATLFGSSLTENTIDDKNKKKEAGAKRSDLPTYTAEEVSKHDNKSSFWVTYKHGVYDVTKFLPSHPGGEQIMNAAGLSIEPFWNVYGMHKTEEVFELLENFRIGNLHDDDVVDHSDEELWVKEPLRDKRLIVKTAKPFNAETPPEHLIAHFDTPNELFYVRQHMPVPELDEGSHRLRVVVRAGTGNDAEFSLEQLGQMPQTTVRATLMCAGNRRSDMTKQVPKPVKGISWAGGAVGTALWGGVLLRDLLLHCGVDLDNPGDKHVIFTGADVDATGTKFSTSLPLSAVCDRDSRILVCTRMNGTPLPADHGRPLRLVVPGAPAVRSVKWLESITISTEESSSHWHKKDYRSFNSSKDWDTADFEKAPPVYSLPVTSAICYPADGDTVKVENGCIEVKGYAYSGGGARIVRVDVSADRGRTWREARLCAQDAAPAARHYAWTLWRAQLPMRTPRSAADEQVEIWAKATDSNFNTQPERFEHIWNIRGILSNAYHRVTVHLAR